MMRFMYAFTWREPPNSDLAGAEQTRVEELIAEGKASWTLLLHAVSSSPLSGLQALYHSTSQPPGTQASPAFAKEGAQATL